MDIQKPIHMDLLFQGDGCIKTTPVDKRVEIAIAKERMHKLVFIQKPLEILPKDWQSFLHLHLLETDVMEV